MSVLKRRILDQTDGRYWALYGQRGVMDFRVMDFTEYGHRDLDSRAAVGMHSIRPQRDDQYPCVGCPFLEGACYVVMSDWGGVWIATQWEKAAFDDEVIWRWLEEFYSGQMAGDAR